MIAVAGNFLLVIVASERMINSRLATGDMESYLHGARSLLVGRDIYLIPSRPVDQGGLYYSIRR